MFVAAVVGGAVLFCGGCSGFPVLGLLSVPAFGFAGFVVDAWMRVGQTENGAGLMDAISPRRGGHVFFLPTWFWSGAIGLVGLWMWLIGAIGLSHPHHYVPGKAEFDQANSTILSDSFGNAYGNSARAEAIAAALSEVGRTFRERAISGEDSEVSLSGRNFVTYAQLDADSAAFLVHVPDLRHSDKDAKAAVATFLWVAAAELVGKHPGGPKKVAVGIRGVMLYDTVLEGEVGGEPHEIDEDALHAYFVPGAPLAPLPEAVPADEAAPGAAATPEAAATDAGATPPVTPPVTP